MLFNNSITVSNNMIRLIICFFLNFFLFTSIRADSSAINVLKNRLKQVDDCYVCFVQKINTLDGNIKAISRGELWIKQPNLFHCHIFEPEESFLISDGKTIWFYVPIIKQVIAYDFKKSINNNVFFKLLFNDNLSKWDGYDVIQQKDWFYLKPTVLKDINLEQYQIKINDQGILNQFSIIETNIQKINYYFFDQRIEPIDISKFRLIMSKDIQCDDQR